MQVKIRLSNKLVRMHSSLAFVKKSSQQFSVIQMSVPFLLSS